MPVYRHNLPQLKGGAFLTDGGMETTLVFHEGADLPHFASFVLLTTQEGREQTAAYYRRYLEIAARHGSGFLLDTPTWRANTDWGAKLGYYTEALRADNEDAVELLTELRAQYAFVEAPSRFAQLPGAATSQASTLTSRF